MTQTDKLRARFLRTPPPKDFRWEDLVRLMEGIGFHLETGRGSRRCFVGQFDGIERRVHLHEPHPDGVLKVYVLREVAQRLRDWFLV